jgi:hypothetical protein
LFPYKIKPYIVKVSGDELLHPPGKMCCCLGLRKEADHSHPSNGKIKYGGSLHVHSWHQYRQFFLSMLSVVVFLIVILQEYLKM